MTTEPPPGPTPEPTLDEILARAAEKPQEVEARMAAAFALDREGREAEALVHYEAAWRLGVPAARRRGFLVGYGSTLRNVGRLEDAVALLGEAIAEDPDYPALKVFLGLALHSSGEHDAAAATLLEALLDVAGGAPLDFQRAIGEYGRALLERAVERG